MANPEHLAIIKQGVEVWNHWRDDNPEIEPDLSQCCLKDLDLSKAMFNNTNLSKAILVDNNFTEAKFYKANLNQATLGRSILDRAYVVETNLDKAQLRETSLIACDLSRSNLFFANLHNANLTKANLFLTNLTKAYFFKANLTQASFYCTQLAQTDLEGAILTGALIKDCNISSANLKNIICDYIYLKHNEQERRPHHKNYQPGDFTKLYQKTIEIVELYFNSGINWEAFLHSFRKFRIECNNSELCVKAIEVRFDLVVIHVAVPKKFSKARVETFIEDEYQIKLKSLEKEYKQQLKIKDEEIKNINAEYHTNLMEIIKQIANQPIEYKIEYLMSKTYQNHYGSGDNIAGNKNISNNTFISPELKQVGDDFQLILDNLKQVYNPNTEQGKEKIVNEAIQRVESNTNLVKRAFSASEKALFTYLKSRFISPLQSAFLAALEDWQKNKQ